MMQRNLRKQTLVSYEYKKDSPKRDKILRNLKTSLLGDIDNSTSINPANRVSFFEFPNHIYQLA